MGSDYTVRPHFFAPDSLGYFFFSAFLIFLSAFFSLGVLAGSFFVSFLLSTPLLMTLLLIIQGVGAYPTLNTTVHKYTTPWSREMDLISVNNLSE